MKLLDILTEENTKPITDKDRDGARKIYKFLKTGVYRPYPDSNKVKYVLPDFEDHMIYPEILHNQITIAVDFNKVQMYIITSGGDLVNARRVGPDDSAVVRNIKHKIISRFKQHKIFILDYFG
jgi:hypothetical protein